VNLLTSDSYRLLCLLDHLQTGTSAGPRVRESQEEIAELFHVSKGKLNPLMQSLVASGCIKKYRARSGYVVTPLGARVVRHIGKLNSLETKQGGATEPRNRT
jgi:DNA-binding GntR family transcriptional regulator